MKREIQVNLIPSPLHPDSKPPASNMISPHPAASPNAEQHRPSENAANTHKSSNAVFFIKAMKKMVRRNPPAVKPGGN